MVDHKKVVFDIKQDADGYPPVTQEGLWSRLLPNGNFVIDNIPFYVAGISSEDEIEAESIDGELRFKKLLKPSGISTFWLILADPETNAKVRAHLEYLGCKSEYNQYIGLIAVEIPSSTPIHPFLDYIMEEKENGTLDFEESALRHKL
ncbi:DUF4265 domain-containing protein [Xanthomonas hyacinthi]|uniref:DUF4265 domain-containing protein n=1 Tax=Xanthomonas hyacinthi TaxID=56455 RepID=A0A2S7EMZ0_9XANT|nr:DUF4265 domain-containing protein [Xanthomonas hyacinthi]KLD73587.1 hypothetical protein Y886_37185 [Xanthomonas hyacinthi DSM 19077]PPU92366.1 DUF4265 domain-containing protein [Xanthomonas hyacinthi]QGY77027.1 DUF4265 domain-containing protein [Xanthomonas hyacinthi]